MKHLVRLSALALAAALAACGSTKATPPGLLLNEPSAVAVFRGVTSKHGQDPSNPVHPYHPYLAIANAGGNDLSIVDAVDDSIVLAPVPLRGLVYPVGGGPMLLASGDLGDLKPDLLVAVSLGDSRLQIVRTWAADGAVEGTVELGGDVLALAALPFDPDALGTVRIAAALADDRIAVVTFHRAVTGDGTAIDVAGATVDSMALGFQPVALAATPDDPKIPGLQTRVWAASSGDLGGGVHGVAGFDVAGPPPWPVQLLDARAPTRLVAAARLAERVAGGALEPATWSTTAPIERVYAVVESGCGLYGPIDCGLVALGAGGLAAGLSTAPNEADYRAPIPLGSRAHGLAAAQPPFAADDPTYAGTFLRLATDVGPLRTTAVAAIAGADVDGGLSFVDLGRWELPSQQHVAEKLAVTAAAGRAPAETGATQVDQWLVLRDPDNLATVSHLDPAALSSAVTLTPGFTPTAHWAVTHEGVLPGLAARRADSGDVGGAPWVALQNRDGSTITAPVRLYDPTLGVQTGDTVVIDATGLGTCARFEADVAELLQPLDGTYPGGAVQLAPKAAHPEWNGCVDALRAPGAAHLLATVRAGGYLLVRGSDAAALHVGRPALGTAFAVEWRDETADAAACLLPPAKAWPATAAAVPSCPEGSACRLACQNLVKARLGRRIGYVAETCASTDTRCLKQWAALPNLSGPALEFTLALQTAAAPPRDLALVLDTLDGRKPFRAVPNAGSPVNPRGITAFDRSPWSRGSGVRFLVPYAGGIVLDATPTLGGGGVNVVR